MLNPQQLFHPHINSPPNPACYSDSVLPANWQPEDDLRRQHPKGAPGQSLLEVLVALVFIALFAAGFAGVAVSVVNGNAKAKSTDIAVFLAHDRLEQIRYTAYSSVTAANFPSEGYGTISIGSPAVPFPDHQRAVAIQNDTPAQGLKRVVVTVSWRGGSISEEMLIGQ